MKTTKNALLISVLLFILASFFSCGRHNWSDVVINTDSIFFDLGKIQVAQRAKMADDVFNDLFRNGLNGVVLYAEQGQVIYEKTAS